MVSTKTRFASDIIFQKQDRTVKIHYPIISGVYFAINAKNSAGTILVFELYPPPPLSTYKVVFQLLAGVAGEIFSDSAPVPKFLNPDPSPDPVIFQI